MPSPLEPFTARGIFLSIGEGDMSDEEESGIYTTPIDEQAYEPLLVIVNDGSVAILDQVAFAQSYNCIAVKYADGVLSVLDYSTRLWCAVGLPVIKSTTMQ